MMYHKTICFIVLIKPLVVVAVNLPPPPPPKLPFIIYLE